MDSVYLFKLMGLYEIYMVKWILIFRRVYIVVLNGIRGYCFVIVLWKVIVVNVVLKMFNSNNKWV